MIEIKFEVTLEKMAEEALENVEENITIGLGSGSTIARFVDALGKYLTRINFKVPVIPSSLQIQTLAERAGLDIVQPRLTSSIDLVVDGVDQMDKNFNMIKGGGGALLREKVLMKAAKKVVILADEEKFVEVLSRKVPIEVVPFARVFVQKELEKIGGKPELRTFKKGYPFFTDNGNVILDVDFGHIDEPPMLLSEIKNIPGVVEAGIFIERLHIIYKACKDGSVKKITPEVEIR
ncbi:MAG: ribose-5-phosphate isomerase RpiA [Candidatus Methylarchaceae archaeon HK01M]|nr:ribose-5-phosphate isomerase RpiA [Candidatus Methylarchaceae archaeon HK01M]